MLKNIQYRLGLASVAASAFVQRAYAQLGGVDDVPGANGLTDVRALILRILNIVLSFMALIAVIFIIIAGIRLVVSQGEDDQKDKARKTIIYVVIGLIVILVAKIIVIYTIGVISSGR